MKKNFAWKFVEFAIFIPHGKRKGGEKFCTKLNSVASISASKKKIWKHVKVLVVPRLKGGKYARVISFVRGSWSGSDTQLDWTIKEPLAGRPSGQSGPAFLGHSHMHRLLDNTLNARSSLRSILKYFGVFPPAPRPKKGGQRVIKKSRSRAFIPPWMFFSFFFF